MSKPIPQDYGRLLGEIEERSPSAQYEALRKGNRELISLYWNIGRLIAERQRDTGWGKSGVEILAADLQAEFLGIGGFSVRNIWRMRNFYLTYHENETLPPLVAEIGWMHNLLTYLIEKKTNVEYALRVESTKPIGVASYGVVSTWPEELRGQLPAPDQVSKLLEDL